MMADEVIDDVIRCKVPKLEPGKTYVSISIDSEHFSEVSLPLKILPESRINDGLVFMLLVLAAAFGLVLIVLRRVTAKMLPGYNDRGSLVSRVAARHGYL
jgi:hypothetical protein